jgi:hypothetical protein
MDVRSSWATLLVAGLATLVVLPQGRAQESSPAGQTFPDTVWNCSGWHTIVDGDSCWTIQQKYNITAAQFLQWNPSVSADCKTNFWLKYSYCVRVGAPGPTMAGIAANCNKWHTVGDGDSCWSIEQKYQITADRFFKWNPAVSTDCVTNFWPKYSYCVCYASSNNLTLLLLSFLCFFHNSIDFSCRFPSIV